MDSYRWQRICDDVRPLLAQVRQSCALSKEILGAGIGVALLYLLGHFSSNVIIPRIFIWGVDPLLARLDLAVDVVDCYTNSVQVVLYLPQYLQELLY